jgi:group I intron endonuclease
MIGIYQIILKTDGRRYFGSSTNIKNRLRVHQSTLKCGTHDNLFLQRSYDKYGKTNFLFEIVEICNMDELLIKEKMYIDCFDSKNENFGFNIEDPENGTRDLSRHFYHPWNKNDKTKQYKTENDRKIGETLRKNCSGSKTKLNWTLVQQIRDEVNRDSNINYSTLARRYNVDRSQISRLVNKKTWREV